MPRENQCSIESLSTAGAGATGHLQAKLHQDLTSYTNISSQWITELNVKL